MRALLFFALSCVPLLDLDGAPCPCGEGAACCETLGVCLPAGATCPEAVPPSDTPCEDDSTCPFGERCAAWKVDDVLMGPKVCKRTCATGVCSEEARCLFSFAGGRDVELLTIERLCLPREPAPECAAWTCEGCPGLALGETTTCDDGDDLMGCVFAVHPECGLKCELRRVGSCNNIAPPCMEFACDRCPGKAPGVVDCRDETMVTCLGSSGGDEPCARLCVEVEVGSCAP